MNDVVDALMVRTTARTRTVAATSQGVTSLSPAPASRNMCLTAGFACVVPGYERMAVR
jgi:hypothetical protein